MSDDQDYPQDKNIGDYKILKELGRGGMGEVYLAQHAYLKKRFALKVLPKDFQDIPGFAALFQKEAQTLGTLKHPNIVEVHNFGVHEGSQYLVMDYIDGGTIHDYHERCNRSMVPEEVISTLQAVMAGVEHAHEIGIIHRDLKPENFLLDSNGVIKITDFGIAQLVNVETSGIQRAAGERISGSDTIVQLAEDQAEMGDTTGGTEGYMAPEVAKGSPGDKRSDFFAIGVIAYYLLTGILPDLESKAVSKVRKGLDKRWDSLIQKCMKENPDDRYSDGSEIIAILDDMAKKPRSMFAPVTACLVAMIAAFFVYDNLDFLISLGKEQSLAQDKSEEIEAPQVIGSPVEVVALTDAEQVDGNVPDQSWLYGEQTDLKNGIISNGGFESGLSNWEMVGDADITVPKKPGIAHSGEHVARIKSNGMPIQSSLLRRIEVERGDRIAVSVWVMTEAISDATNFTARLRLTAMTDAFKPLAYQDNKVSGEVEWKELTLDLIINDEEKWLNISTVDINLMLRADAKTVAISYFDHLKVVLIKPDDPRYSQDSIL